MVEHASDHFKVWPLLLLFIQDGKIPLDRFAAILEVIQHTKPLQPCHPTSILLINQKARSIPTVFCYHCTHYNANLKHKSLYDLVARDPILASEWAPNHHMVCHLLIIITTQGWSCLEGVRSSEPEAKNPPGWFQIKMIFSQVIAFEL